MGGRGGFGEHGKGITHKPCLARKHPTTAGLKPGEVRTVAAYTGVETRIVLVKWVAAAPVSAFMLDHHLITLM